MEVADELEKVEVTESTVMKGKADTVDVEVVG